MSMIRSCKLGGTMRWISAQICKRSSSWMMIQKDMEVDQASKGEFLVFKGEDATESDQEVIVVSEENDDMGGDVAKDKSSEKEDPAEEDSSKDSKDSGCLESLENEQEGQGWYNPTKVGRQARLENLVEKVCEELRFRSGQSNQEAVDKLWEEFAEMTKSRGKYEDDTESTN